MESINKHNITQHCLENKINNLKSSAQHDFAHRKSTVANLLELTTDILKERDSGNNVDFICIDFAKVFDTVPHKQLIYKLSQYGIARFVL